MCVLPVMFVDHASSGFVARCWFLYKLKGFVVFQSGFGLYELTLKLKVALMVKRKWYLSVRFWVNCTAAHRMLGLP
jgi:hypothetical protein